MRIRSYSERCHPLGLRGHDPRSLKDPMRGERERYCFVFMTHSSLPLVPMAAAGTPLAWTAPVTPIDLRGHQCSQLWPEWEQHWVLPWKGGTPRPPPGRLTAGSGI